MAKADERNVISSAELADSRERLCHPISMAELQRRWAAIRAQMSEAKIDAWSFKDQTISRERLATIDGSLVSRWQAPTHRP